MEEKLHGYQGYLGRLHVLRTNVVEKIQEFREGFKEDRNTYNLRRNQCKSETDEIEEYSHVFRRKTACELMRISAAVTGIEFSYAAETAFVSPTLLKIGVDHQHMTMVWALSPIVGFILTPLLGSMSDRCRLKMGRRRPFILLLALGTLLGLLLVPNGEDIGHALGDFYPSRDLPLQDVQRIVEDLSKNKTANVTPVSDSDFPHPWGVAFTIIGTVLIDFDSDACQSPSRAYLLDVTLPEDHARGLSMFTIMAGVGGFFGYAMGGINWDVTPIGELLGGHVRAVFTIITFIFIICITATVTSFKEMPLNIVERLQYQAYKIKNYTSPPTETSKVIDQLENSYGTLELNAKSDNMQSEKTGNGYVNYGFDDAHGQPVISETSFSEPAIVPNGYTPNESETAEAPTLKQYLWTIVYMPCSLWILCLTNLFCWSAHVCYSLYFTDYVGESVFNGNPKADVGTNDRSLYEEGVRFGCFGMSMYSLSCSCFSFVIEKLINKYGAKKIYVGNLLIYAVGMSLMAALNHKAAVIVFSAAAGVLYSTMFTMPYLLVAHYHASGKFSEKPTGEATPRGLGTDVAIVSSMVFVAQFMISMSMGTIVSSFESTRAVVIVAAFLGLCAGISATMVTYLDL